MEKCRSKMSSRQKSAWTKSGLHTDIVISRRQCAEWAAWYNNGEGREHPEFDIFGPFTNPQEQVRGNNPEEWLACASKLDALKAKQAKGRGNGGPSTPNASTIRQQQNGSVGLASTYRTVTDDRRLFIDSDQTVTVSLPDGNVRMLEVPGGRSTAKGDCLVTVKTYSIASDYQQSTPATSYWGRPRPFYKDYRHYSRFGFAGQGAKTAWACNQKMTKEDYDPAVALYTKQHSSPSSAVRNEEIYVEMPARCDLQPKLTPVQQRLLWEFPEHRLGRIPSALEAPEDRSPRKRAASKPPSPVG